ncbi:hypothetical protein [Phormidesmis priestleyi]
MRINSTVALTFILLTLMFGAGVVSGAWGFAIGREALKGITQPDARPTNKVNKKNTSGRGEDLVILKEDDILKAVKGRIDGGTPKSSAPPSPSPKADDKQTSLPGKFPFVSQDKGVTIELTGVRQQADSVVYDVALKNEGTQPVKFLYSFLNIADEQGRALSADTAGLPTELPAGSPKFTGTVSISTALLDKAQKLSVQLTDYPDQKLQLKLSDVPVR